MIVLVTKEAGLRKKLSPKTKGLNPDLSLELEIPIIVVQIISVDNALHMEKLAKVVVGKIILLKSADQKARARATQVLEAKKSFKYREVNVDQESSDDGQIDEKVRSMYYNDVHFNGVNSCIHIRLSTKSCNGNSLKTHFKLDTGADGNLLPLGEFFKHFPNVNMT